MNFRMKNYEVTLLRTRFETATVRVKAHSKEDARIGAGELFEAGKLAEEEWSSESKLNLSAAEIIKVVLKKGGRMIITKRHPRDGDVEGIFRGHWFRAVVHDEPSMFGIEQSRTSMLFIAKDAHSCRKLAGPAAGYYYHSGLCIVSLKDYDGIIRSLISELDNLPLLSAIPETPNIAKMVKDYIDHSAFGGLYKEGCCCWGDGIMECQRIINVDVSMCRAGYKHKFRLDGITIKPYPPERKK